MLRVALISIAPEKMTRLKQVEASLRKAGYDVVVFKPAEKPRFLPSIAASATSYLLSLAKLATLKADIYHVFNVPDILAIPILAAGRAIVYDVRSPWGEELRFLRKSSMLALIAEAIEKYVTRKADVVVCVNRVLAARARAWGAREVYVVPNRPTAGFKPTLTREELRRIAGIPPDAKLAVYAGNISEIEGASILKRCIKAIAAHEGMYLAIVGDGDGLSELRREAERQATSRVLLTGRVPREDVANWINAADLCLAPRPKSKIDFYYTPESVWKIGEYLALGKPVLATDIRGFRGSSYPVITASEEEYPKKLIELLRSPPEPAGSLEPWELACEPRLLEVYQRLESRLLAS